MPGLLQFHLYHAGAAVDRYPLAITQQLRGIPGGDHRRHTVLPCDNRRVGQNPA